jgi:N-acetylmuramoyl-L-alanine amidase
MLLWPSAAGAAFPHVVAPGESLTSIAAADGLSVAQLAAANALSTDAYLIAGSTLLIPPQDSGSSSGTAGPSTGVASTGAGSDDDAGSDGAGQTIYVSSTSTPASAGAYLVQPGDTLSGIAARAGVSVADLAAANGLDPRGWVFAGTVLRLPGSSGSTGSASAGEAASSQPVGAAAEGSPTAPPYPTPETVSASQIGQVAAANGVPPSLAEAVAWQESGFNNDLVSTADARGVMQILPGTWDWIQRTLTAGMPLAPASAADNVRGGVLLLHSLLQATGGDPAMAAAGYYQGLPSVRASGVFADTQQYVNNVLALDRQFGGG